MEAPNAAIQLQALLAEAQGRVTRFQAQLFQLRVREESLAAERQTCERELAGAIGSLNAFGKAREIAAAAQQQAAKAQGGPAPVPAPEDQ
jgi:septal ring factor EnvC (AmiA/AmiB activator)